MISYTKYPNGHINTEAVMSKSETYKNSSKIKACEIFSMIDLTQDNHILN